MLTLLTAVVAGGVAFRQTVKARKLQQQLNAVHARLQVETPASAVAEEEFAFENDFCFDRVAERIPARATTPVLFLGLDDDDEDEDPTFCDAIVVIGAAYPETADGCTSDREECWQHSWCSMDPTKSLAEIRADNEAYLDCILSPVGFAATEFVMEDIEAAKSPTVDPAVAAAASWLEEDLAEELRMFG